jgi:AraC family transcriptional regulator
MASIARRAGYGSEEAFSRAFADAYGLPPGRYRSEGSHRAFETGRLESPNRSWSIAIRRAEPMTLAAISHRGSYMEIGRAFEALFGQAMKQGLLTPTVHMIGVYHDDPTAHEEASLRSHAGLVDPSRSAAPLEVLTTPGGDYAVLRHKGPYADMRAAYVWMFGTWLPQSGREPAQCTRARGVSQQSARYAAHRAADGFLLALEG